MSPENERHDAESVKEETKETVEETGKKVSRAKYEKLQEELEKAIADKEHWKNEYYRAYADTQNLRKSLEEESRSAIRYRAEGFLESLLPALDSFHMALEMPAPTKEAQNYQIGFTYIYNQIVASLANEGVSEITPNVGDPYDVNTMHAVDHIETTEVKEGCVARVTAKGYRLHDRLVRAAMVYIAKAPAPKAEEPKSEDSANSGETTDNQA
ncbi:MAG: nucleotide exchange factor GrpE [Candidatus Enteromonas sp.]|nr:nucleotide exchange factor GrpE [Candidatus Enteromonas sp.]